jgi:hypothetical protein
MNVKIYGILIFQQRPAKNIFKGIVRKLRRTFNVYSGKKLKQKIKIEAKNKN